MAAHSNTYDFGQEKWFIVYNDDKIVMASLGQRVSTTHQVESFETEEEMETRRVEIEQEKES